MAARNLLLATGFIALLPMAAGAAGFAFYEAGAKAVGMSGAFTATADDPSAIYYNPAGLAFQKGTMIMAGGTFVVPTYSFKGANPFPGQGVSEHGKNKLHLVPGVYYRHPINDQIMVGIGTFLPFGLGTEWENPTRFTGRFISQKADLKSLSIQPTIAYKVNDWMGVGFGLDIRESVVNFQRNRAFLNPFTQHVVDLAKIDMQSNWKTSVGFSFGVLVKPIQDWRVGFSYRHSVKTDFDGTATFEFIPTGNPLIDPILKAQVPQGDRKVATSINFPKEMSLGIATTMISKMTIEVDVNYTGWSTFDELVIDFKDLGQKTVFPEKYKDCFNFRFGIERVLNEKLALRGGYYYDESPQPLESTGPLLPDSDRQGINFGAGYKMGRWSVDGSAILTLFNERSTVFEGLPQNRDNYNGTYRNHAILSSASLSYAF